MERFMIKFHDCPYCKAKQSTCYLWESELHKKHICGTCQIGVLKPTEIKKSE